MTPDELDEHCQFIYRSPRIDDTVVILCEGRPIKARETEGYGNLESYPDAYFYKHCVPAWWTQNQLPRPIFFNCGGRSNVIQTYFRLLELHSHPRDDSFLDVNKLFAIVDLDIQAMACDTCYPFVNTEEIFRDLYQCSQVNQQNAVKHKIWVTGLVHKEAYFLAPELQELFDNYPKKLLFSDNPLNLWALYRQMANEMIQDQDLAEHFLNIIHRISHFSALNNENLTNWQQTWIAEFEQNETKRKELVYLLLTVRKAKEYWEKLMPFDERPVIDRKTLNNMRDELSIKIAGFYANAENACQFHIPCFLKMIHDVVYAQ